MRVCTCGLRAIFTFVFPQTQEVNELINFPGLVGIYLHDGKKGRVALFRADVFPRLIAVTSLTATMEIALGFTDWSLL